MRALHSLCAVELRGRSSGKARLCAEKELVSSNKEMSNGFDLLVDRFVAPFPSRRDDACCEVDNGSNEKPAVAQSYPEDGLSRRRMRATRGES